MTDIVEKAKELLAKSIQGRFFTTRECINTIEELIGEAQKLQEELFNAGLKKSKGGAIVKLADPGSFRNFEEIWAKYPRKLKKTVSFDRFEKQVKTEQDWEDIQKALPNYIADVENQRANGHPNLAWQHGSTWFNNNWRDYVVPLEDPAAKSGSWKAIEDNIEKGANREKDKNRTVPMRRLGM